MLRSKWLGLVIVVLALVTAALITIGYEKWPSIHEGCKVYSCDWIVDEMNSGCITPEKCSYYWRAVIDGVQSFWVWGQKDDNGDGDFATNTTTFIYPNGTVCYRPVECDGYYEGSAMWIQGYKCLPVLNCTNGDRIDARYAFVYVLSIGLGVSYVGLFVYWIYLQHKYSQYEYYDI